MTEFPPGGAPIEIDTRAIRDLTPDVLDPVLVRPRVLPASYWAGTTALERATFGHRWGAYVFPTVELVEELTALIAGRTAIEIAAGNGALAAALGIRATDSHQQQDPKIRAFYQSIGQPIVPYGPNVERLDARNAVSRYRPQVVIGAWVTWRPDPRRPHLGGNAGGVNEHAILARCETYIHIGNTEIHAIKPLNALPHATHNWPTIYSRAHNGTPDHVKVWHRDDSPVT